MVVAANGKKVPALTVFSHTLRYFRDHALRELTDATGAKVVSEDVRWVITVPAIWQQRSKQFMREAAYMVRRTDISACYHSSYIFRIPFTPTRGLYWNLT